MHGLLLAVTSRHPTELIRTLERVRDRGDESAQPIKSRETMVPFGNELVGHAQYEVYS